MTTVTGRVLLEKISGDEVEVSEAGELDCGFVQDLSSDLQVGVITPFLLLCEMF